jgi:hypothetical protein
MICRIGDVVRCGEIVTIEADVAPETVAAAVREERDPADTVAVSCPDPTPLHEAVGCIHPEIGLRTKTALAQAGRTRGLTTPYDDDLQAAREELAEMTVEMASLADHRETKADAESAVDQARIRAAQARGRLREREESGLETADAQSRLDDALRELSEAETAAIAADQAYTGARERRRERQDIRERRFRLQDRVANYERQVRAHLVEQLRDEFREALMAVPGRTTDPASEGGADSTVPFDADPVLAALAVARLGVMTAPVVLAVDWFESPRRASEWLDAPVVYL